MLNDHNEFLLISHRNRRFLRQKKYNVNFTFYQNFII